MFEIDFVIFLATDANNSRKIRLTSFMTFNYICKYLIDHLIQRCALDTHSEIATLLGRFEILQPTILHKQIYRSAKRSTDTNFSKICHFHREQSNTKQGNSEACVKNRVSCEEPASYDANLIFLRNFQNHCDSFEQPIHLEYFNEALTNTNIKKRRILPNGKCKW